MPFPKFARYYKRELRLHRTSYCKEVRIWTAPAILPLLFPLQTLHAQTLDVDIPRTFLTRNCQTCHQGESAAGGFNINAVADWSKVLNRVKNGEMPPRGFPAPDPAAREAFVARISADLHNKACAGGPRPGTYPLRRLNRDEYAATVRDLLNIHFNAAHALPFDGAGGEGFDNAAETLFLSPIHSEKYLEAAREALSAATKDPDSRKAFLIAQPGPNLPPDEAATKVLNAFLPRAFRRPVSAPEFDRYFDLYSKAVKRGETYEHSLLLALQAVLISPNFLFRAERASTGPVDGYALATRLSYFLWGTMPDKALTAVAATAKLNTPEVLQAQVARMLKDPKAQDFATRFIEQWLATRELGRDIQPDLALFPAYADAELQSAIRYEPILFFQELLAKDLPLTNLLDADFTFLTDKLARHYGLPKLAGLSGQPKRFTLPADSHRGGILTMAATLAVSSYPQRTSPVLRGKWILENILGTPPPPPPPDVPALQENPAGAAAKTLRERLEQHRANPVCATCHSRIDPLGFALENYNPIGVWRTTDAGQPIDSAGVLPDGTKFQGASELKQILLARKDVFLRNFTSKMLGYSLGRGLTLNDGCTVDAIMNFLAANQYSTQTLIREIVLATPFRYRETGK